MDNLLNSVKRPTPDSEKEFVKVVTGALINHDAINLSQGVSLTYDGRTRKNQKTINEYKKRCLYSDSLN